MPTKLFWGLDDKKKDTILSSAIAEFSACGYKNASTNIIVKNCDISKGSLFKYFANKEELYFFILDIVTAELSEDLEQEKITLSKDFFQRVFEYSAMELSWYIQNPIKAKLIINAFTKDDSDIYHKTIKRYGVKELDIYNKLLEDVDFDRFRCDKEKAVNIIKWFLKGFNEDFLEHIQHDTNSLENLHNEYLHKINEYIVFLKTGLLK